MPTIPVTTQALIDGVNYEGQESLVYVGTVKTESSVAAAKSGTLTTRTSATAGTLTMADAGHGITDGQRLDIHFSGGVAYGATVGTVSGTSVPFTGAEGADGTSGEALPAASTAVQAAVPEEDEFAVTAASLKGLVAYCTTTGTSAVAVFAQSNDTTVLAADVSGQSGAYFWTTGSGASNPFGATVAKVYLSHNDTASAQTMRAVALIG